jgi:uncharacterized protein
MIPVGMIQVWIKTWVFVSLLLMTVCSLADETIPPFKSHVTDLTATLSAHEAQHLAQQLIAFEKAKGSQVAVLIVSTTHPETIEQYSIRVAEAWELGRKGIDDGVLLLIAKKDRTLRIEVGYGLEGVLPDATTKRIIEETIVPQFKAGKFTDGIEAGIQAILSLITGESLPQPSSKRGSNSFSTLNALSDNFIPILVGLIVIGRLMQVLLGRLVGAIITGIGAGAIGWLLFSSVIIAILIAAFAFIISIFQHASSGIYRNGRSHRSHDNYWRGGNGTGGFGGGGGGFGGGGGGFGGGGASGRW